MNMSNSTELLSSDIKWEVLRHSLYIIQGLVNVILNSLIVLTIARHEALRYAKEYVALGAAAFADVMDSLAPLSAGLYRIPVWLSHTHVSPASSRFCLLRLHNMLWSWTDVNATAMLVVLSLDRVLSVAKPLEYDSRSYVLGMVSLAYGLSFVLGALSYISQWPKTEPVHTKICWTSYAFGMGWEQARNTVMASCTLLSIALYLLVPVIFWHKEKSVGPVGAQGGEALAKAEFQRQVNKSVSLSCLFTFVFVALPWLITTVGLSGDASHEVYEAVAVWAGIIAGIDPMVNLYIYYKKQVYFRKGFKALWENKTLPMALTQW